MAEVTAPPAPATMESVGSVPARGTDARTYEQITDALKAEHAEESETEVAPETPEAPPETPAEQPMAKEQAEDELRTMTDQEIAALPPELQKEAKALRKRFQAAYTKKTMDLAEIRRKAEIVDRFDSDPTFQDQVIQQIQRSRGTQQAPVTAAQAAAPAGPPAALVEMARKSIVLPPEMEWMRDTLAQSQAAFGAQLVQAMQSSMIQPLQQNLTAMQQQRQEQEYLGVLNDFAERNPGWDEKEDDMVEVLEFLRSPSLTHPRWGTKHDLLYRLAQGDQAEANAIQKTIETTAQKVKTRSVVSSGAGRGTTSNLDERIRDRKISNDKAWDLIRAQVTGR